MKFLILFLAILGLANTSPIVSPAEPSLILARTENIPGDGSPEAWAILNEAQARRTSSNKRSVSAIFKRDSFNCNGSSSCFAVTEGGCNRAVDQIDDNTWYREYMSRKQHTCTCIYTCENGDFGGGWPGWFLKQKMWSINDVGGCRACGSCYFWGTCRVTYNYVSW